MLTVSHMLSQMGHSIGIFSFVMIAIIRFVLTRPISSSGLRLITEGTLPIKDVRGVMKSTILGESIITVRILLKIRLGKSVSKLLWTSPTRILAKSTVFLRLRFAESFVESLGGTFLNGSKAAIHSWSGSLILAIELQGSIARIGLSRLYPSPHQVSVSCNRVLYRHHQTRSHICKWELHS